MNETGVLSVYNSVERFIRPILSEGDSWTVQGVEYGYFAPADSFSRHALPPSQPEKLTD
jgi:hypothetical protein